MVSLLLQNGYGPVFID